MRYVPRRMVMLGVVLACWLLVMTIALRAFAQGTPLQGQSVIAQGQVLAAPLVLRDQRGRTTSLRSVRGRVVVVTFLDVLCREECPVMGRELAAVQRSVGTATPWTLLVVSVAPGDDTPANIARFAHESAWQGDWRWLTGTPAQLRAVWRAYGIYVRPTATDVIHTPALYVVDPTGSVRIVDMAPFSPAELARSIQVLAPRADAGWMAWLPRL
ncbi:MAG: hypothetical protein NVSMB65_19880 [Chloroflexota bacterium]